MSVRPFFRFIWALGALSLVTAALAEDRLVINVSKARRTQSSSNAIHYQPTGSVRHSEQRSYSAAQQRQSTREAQGRDEVQPAQERRTTSAQTRREVQGAESRSYSRATDRHGSVHLDTVR